MQFQYSGSHPKMFQRLYFDNRKLLPRDTSPGFETIVFKEKNDVPNVREQVNKNPYGG